MAKYLLSVHSVEGEAGDPMTEQEMQQFMGRVGVLEEEMKAEGAWLFGGALHEAETATVVRVSNGDVLTTDGPFAEAKEHLGGFYIIEADDLDAALAWASKTSAAVAKPIEVRPFRRATACRPTRAAGSPSPPAIERSTGCAAWLADRNSSAKWRCSRPKATTSANRRRRDPCRTTASVSSSLAATRHSRPTHRSRSRSVYSAA